MTSPLQIRRFVNCVDPPDSLLANDIPALTFAAGHRGIQLFDNVDLRENYINGSWPRQGNEWRHSDIFTVGLPYVYEFYDAVKNDIEQPPKGTAN